ncbi:MAG: acyl-CoA dehydrogenase, partial [Actinobacteria bacterium]|nr:acyl-CoA dehydrogenase [Actinomycetota bacterium]
AVCVGRARRALNLSIEWAATREQFGQQIGKFQGVSFKLADMQTRLDAAELLTLRAAWNDANGNFDDSEMAMAKVFASEIQRHIISRQLLRKYGG